MVLMHIMTQNRCPLSRGVLVHYVYSTCAAYVYDCMHQTCTFNGPDNTLTIIKCLSYTSAYVLCLLTPVSLYMNAWGYIHGSVDSTSKAYAVDNVYVHN